MAADYEAIVRELLAFRDLTGLTVLSVGAGGGQLIGYGRAAGRVIAVDPDTEALRALEARLSGAGLKDKYTIRQADFLRVEDKADCVLFEFSLHELPGSGAALEHALRLAPCVVVLDHYPGSPWLYYVDEQEKVKAAWEAVEGRTPTRRKVVEAVQVFPGYAELRDKLAPQGATALERAEAFRGRSDIRIPMLYGLAEFKV